MQASHDEDRREHTRFAPDPWLPIVFGSPRSELRCAGHVVDISEGGARIIAPPSCPVPLAWGDPFEVTIGYSESARRFGFEGLELSAVVVRVLSDSRAYTINAMFRQRHVHDRLRDYLALLSQGESGFSETETMPAAPRR